MIAQFHPIRRHRAFLLIATTFAIQASALSGRVFTDINGRTTDAELAGVVGQNVILRKGGIQMSWPLAKLSPEDQRYVREWQANPPATPKLGVQIWKKTGISPSGTFADEPGGPDGMPNIPGIHEVRKRDSFRYFDVSITNSNPVQANLLTMSYQMYVITADGAVVVETAAEAIPSIGANLRTDLTTKSISTSRTKTTTLTLGTNVFGGLTTGQQVKRGSERFGGVWVKVFSHDGKMVGEAKDLEAGIERMKPIWVAPTRSNAPDIDGGLDGLDAMVEQVRGKLAAIRKLLDGNAPLPAGDGKRPSPPIPPFSR